MSRAHTGAAQRARLAALGLRTVELPPLRDVDDIAAARAAAAGGAGEPLRRGAARDRARGGRGMTATAHAPRRSRALEPAELLYGRLLASAAAGGEPGDARFRLADGRAQQLPLGQLARAGRRRRPRRARARGGAGARHRLRSGPPPRGARRGRPRRARPRPLPRRGAARARPRRRGDPALGLRRRPARRDVARPRCCSTATSASAARPRRCSPAPARSSRPAAPCWSRPARRARRRAASACGSRRPGAISPWFGWATVGAHGIAPLARAAGLAPAGDVPRGRPLVRAAGAPGDEAAAARARSGPRSGSRRCAARGSPRCWARPARARRGRRADRLPLARRLPARPRAQRARRPRPPVHDVLRLADRAVVAVRAHAGGARQRRAGRGAGAAREALVGDPAAVRVAAGAHARRGGSSAPSIALLVASTGFLFATGIANIQYWYVFGFDFVKAHYYAAVVFVAALAVHLVVKVPVALRAYRSRGVLAPLRDDLAATAPGAGRRPRRRSRPTRRRSAGAACWPRSAAAPRRCSSANAGRVDRRPAAQHRVPRAAARGRLPGQQDRGRARRSRRRWSAPATGSCWRGGPAEVELTLAELLALPQATHTLTLGCVEGWSTRQTWTGVPLLELARRAGVDDPEELLVESLQPQGILRQATLARRPGGRLALAAGAAGRRRGPLDGPRLPGARSSSPALPGVHNTKWVGRLAFRA